MLKKITFYFILFFISASPKTLGFAEFQQNLRVYYPSSLNIQAISPNLTKGIISSDTGILEQISATFRIDANGSLYNYDFVLNANANTKSGLVNAYHFDGSNMYIILTNSSSLPQLSAINNIKSSTPKKEENSDTIAYPITNQSYAIYSAEVKNNASYGGYYYNLLSYWYEAIFRQNVGNSPYLNTYSIQNDTAGIYEATLTLSAIPRP